MVGTELAQQGRRASQALLDKAIIEELQIQLEQRRVEGTASAETIQLLQKKNQNYDATFELFNDKLAESKEQVAKQAASIDQLQSERDALSARLQVGSDAEKAARHAFETCRAELATLREQHGHDINELARTREKLAHAVEESSRLRTSESAAKRELREEKDLTAALRVQLQELRHNPADSDAKGSSSYSIMEKPKTDPATAKDNLEHRNISVENEIILFPKDDPIYREMELLHARSKLPGTQPTYCAILDKTNNRKFFDALETLHGPGFTIGLIGREVLKSRCPAADGAPPLPGTSPTGWRFRTSSAVTVKTYGSADEYHAGGLVGRPVSSLSSAGNNAWEWTERVQDGPMMTPGQVPALSYPVSETGGLRPLEALVWLVKVVQQDDPASHRPVYTGRT